MHYNIDGVTIKSEYAAKSKTQPNRTVLNIIKRLPDHFVALDYGCGKLRYSIPLSNIIDKVYAVDSKEQIYRIQSLEGHKMTLSNFTEIDNLIIEELSSNNWKNRGYDFILCTNVLSAIPCSKKRLEVLTNIRDLLVEQGSALITAQYRNSYFDSYKNRDNTIEHDNGWIIKNKGYNSYYGIITPERLMELVSVVGLKVVKKIVKNGSVYLIVSINGNENFSGDF